MLVTPEIKKIKIINNNENFDILESNEINDLREFILDRHDMSREDTKRLLISKGFLIDKEASSDYISKQLSGEVPLVKKSINIKK